MSSPKVNYAVLGGGFLVVLPLVAILASGFGNNPHAVPSMMEGKSAPDFTLVDLDGNTVGLEALKGGPVVLNFWSTWCQPCKLEHPVFQAAARANPDVRFLGVIYSDDPQKVKIYLSKVGSTYANLVDDYNRTAIDYGVTGVPETFFINSAGTIVKKDAQPLYPALMADRLQLVRQ
jgi:cytochrome c biogenesis protein CcmG/thiol:disulfide interchange protein DsbE